MDCRLLQVEGVLNKNAVHRNFTARSKLDCVKSSCDCFTRCVVSFHRLSNVCISAPLSPLPLDWMQQCKLLTATEDPSWSSAISSAAITKSSTWERPKGLWLMDSVFRGCNLGTGGQKLDSSDVRVTWTRVGPRGDGSDLRYSRLDKNTRPVIQIKHGSSFLLNASQSLTVLVWVKTDNVKTAMPILEGRKKTNYTTLFWFFPSDQRDQVQMAHFKAVESTVNSQGREFWRHLVFRYHHPTSDYKMYLNGTLWPEKFRFQPPITSWQPEKFQIGFREPSFFFHGSMACIIFFEKALSNDEIQSVKNTCP